MAKSSAYWEKRATRRLTDAEKQGEAYSKRVQKIYNRAQKNVQRDIDAIYRKYSKETGIDEQTLRELLTASETDKIWEEMKAKGLDKYVKGNYKARITRLEQMKAEIYTKVKGIYPDELKTHTECYTDVLNDTYYKSIYDAQMGVGVDFGFSTLDDNLVKSVLNEGWSGANFSKRIWGNTDLLAEAVSEIVGGALLSGQSIAKTSRQIRERFDVAKYYADRLVRTETNYFHNQADAMAYEEMGVEKYVFMAVLDTRTSSICQSLDNKAIDLKDKQVGVNYPPMHPNCRSTTRAYMGEEIEATLTRRARNPVTGKNEVINNMSYEEWYNAKVKTHGQPVIDNAFKKSRNRSDDVKQFESYKLRLKGSPNLPTNIDKFQDLKYNNSDEFKELTEHYRYKGRVPEATVEDFKTYKAIKETGIKGTIRVPPKRIDINTLTFNDEHASNHGSTLEDAKMYVQNAKYSLSRKRWDGYHTNYYSVDGATYVEDETHKIKTAFPKEDFDPIVQATMEVFK